jgi:hypothetical protein
MRDVYGGEGWGGGSGTDGPGGAGRGGAAVAGRLGNPDREWQGLVQKAGCANE